MRIAVITGASGGLGRALAIRCAKTMHGIDEYWLIARRADSLRETAGMLGKNSRILDMDITQKESLDNLESMLDESGNEVVLLINCAGSGKIEAFSDMDMEDIGNMIRLNCEAAANITYLVLKHMRKGAKILQICSTAGFQPFQYISLYSATKAFFLSFSRSLRLEMLGKGISVSAVCPYWIRDTDFITEARKAKNTQKAVRHFPLAARANTIAAVTVFLLRFNLPVITPDIVSAAHRIACKIIPREIMMYIWAGIRRI